jgi:uncharacterized protein YjgD (DUF1641 family)
VGTDVDAIVSEILSRIPPRFDDTMKVVEKAIREGVSSLNIDELSELTKFVNKLKKRGLLLADDEVIWAANYIEDLLKKELSENTVKDILRRSTRRAVEA